MSTPGINDTVANLLKLLAECETLAESQEETRSELASLIRQAQARQQTVVGSFRTLNDPTTQQTRPLRSVLSRG
jgi:hypothetical protein